MNNWLNKHADIWIMMIYEYVRVSCYLVIHPQRTFRNLCVQMDESLISPALYFVINIFVMQTIAFIISRVANKTGTSDIISGSWMFKLPFFGDVGASYIFNFLGYHIGAAIVLFVLICLIENGKEYFDYVKNAVLYSSVITILLGFINVIIVMLALIFLCFLMEVDISDFSDISSLNMLSDIKKIEELIAIIYYSSILEEIVSCVIYFWYIYLFISVYVPLELVKKTKTIFCLVSLGFLVCLSVFLNFGLMKDEVESIKESIVKISEPFDIIVYEDVANGSVIEEIYFEKKVYNEFLKLSSNKLMSAQDRLRVFKMYFLQKNEELIPEEEIKESLYFVYGWSTISDANDKYVNYLADCLKYSGDVKILDELKKLADLEKKIHNKSSFEIFMNNFYLKKHKDGAWYIVPLSLIKIIP